MAAEEREMRGARAVMMSGRQYVDLDVVAATSLTAAAADVARRRIESVVTRRRDVTAPASTPVV